MTATITQGKVTAKFSEKKPSATKRVLRGDDSPYFGELSNCSRTLKHEEVCRLSRIVQAGLAAEKDILTLYEVENKSAEVTRNIAELQQLIDSGKDAQNRIVMANLRLVVRIASRHQLKNQHLHILDLVQEGNIGLMGAARKFDPDKGCKFSTYAVWWIRQSILKLVRDQGRTIRIPVYLWDWMREREKITKEFEIKGEPFTDEDVRLACGRTELEWDRMTNNIRSVTSISHDSPSGNYSDRESAHSKYSSSREARLMPDHLSVSPEEFAWNSFVRQSLTEALEALKAYDKDLYVVITMRCPLESGHSKATYKQIADATNTNPAWASAAYARGIEWLKENTDASLFELGE
jgi:RNA polymerase sigma factor (sigma-70 family)